MNSHSVAVGTSETEDGVVHATAWLQGAGALDLGGTPSTAVAVNKKGEVAGQSQTTASAEFHAFWIAEGGMVDLGTLGGTSSTALGLSSNGQVVGRSFTTGSDKSTSHAFSWTEKTGLVDLGTLGGSFSSAAAVNSHDLVVGTSQTAGNASSHATVWR